MDAESLALLSWQFFFPLKVSAWFASSIFPLYLGEGVTALPYFDRLDPLLRAIDTASKRTIYSNRRNENSDLAINSFQALLGTDSSSCLQRFSCSPTSVHVSVDASLPSGLS